MRKVPVNVAAIDDDMEKYIGCPYVDVKNPFDTEEKTYAEYFEHEFERSIVKFGIKKALSCILSHIVVYEKAQFTVGAGLW